MANTTKGSGKTKKKTSASGTAKKKQTQTTARKTTAKKSSTAKRTSGTRKNTVREPMDEGVRAEIILLSVLAVSILTASSEFETYRLYPFPGSNIGLLTRQGCLRLLFRPFRRDRVGSTGSDLLWNSILHSKQTELFNCAENRGSDQLLRLFLRFYAASGVRLYERYDISGLLF